MSEAHFTYLFSLSAEVAEQLPPFIDCRQCGKRLIEITRDHILQTFGVRVFAIKPPEVLDMRGMRGLIECPACGAQAPIDLRMFVAHPNPSH